MMTSNSSRFVQVRPEEIGIGVLLGAGTVLAALSPLTLGLPSLNPLAAGIGAVGFAQASLLWAGALAGGAVGGWWAARQERDTHVSGAQYIPDRARARAMLQAAQRERFSQAQREHVVTGVTIGGVEFARDQEVGHIVVVGVTGSGKTVLLKWIIDDVHARGGRVIIHDPKGDFTALYFDPASAVILGPYDSRATLWNAAVDVDSPALADSFAQACVGDVQGENKSFYDNAAKVIAGLLKSYMRGGKPWTWVQLARDLELDPRAMAAQAALGDPHVKGAVPSAFRTDNKGLSNGDSSTFSIVSSGTKWIANYAAVYRPDAPHFSITRWLLQQDHQNVRTVILNNNAQYGAAAKAVFGAILQSAVAVVNSAKMKERSAGDPDGLWVIADELPQLGPSALEAIQKLSELGRSRGIRCVLAMQDESQLAALVGEAKAKPMLSVQGAHVFLQCSATTAEAVSRRIGKRNVNRIETTGENGAQAGKTKRLVEQQVIEPGALLGLHVHRDGPTPGVELILQLQDTLGRLIQPFPARRPAIAAPLVESNAWRMGTLPGARIEPESAPGAQPAAVPPSADAILTPFDMPSDPAPDDAADGPGNIDL